MGIRDLLVMDDGPEKDALAKKMGVQFSKPKNVSLSSLLKPAAATKKIKGDPESIGKTELQIENEICMWLFRNRIEHWKMKVKGEIHSIGKGKAIIKPSQNTGFPDVLCCVNGSFVGVEVKKPKGVQSAHQIAMEKRINSAKGLYFIVTSVNELSQKFLQHKLI